MPDEGTPGDYVPSLPDPAEQASRTLDVTCATAGDRAALSVGKWHLAVVWEEAGVQNA